MVLAARFADESPLALLRQARAEADVELRRSLTKASMLALTLCVAALLARAWTGGALEQATRTVPLPGYQVIDVLVPPAPLGKVQPIAPAPRTDGAVLPVKDDALDRTQDFVPPARGIEGVAGDQPGPGGPGTGTSDLVAPPPPPDPGPYDPVYYEELPAPVYRAMPAYPPIAKDAGMEGRVLVRMMVGIDGRVRKAEIEHGSELFDDAALAAARQWTFTPAKTDGHPVVAWVRVPFEFRLH